MIGLDDLARDLAVSSPSKRASYSVAGDTYTIIIPGDATAGRYAAIDMHVPPGGGPGPHRHACEEMFLVLDGEIEVVFRDRRVTATAGTAVNVPENAPHMFRNRGDRDARLLSVVAPAGLDALFAEAGVPASTTTAPPLPQAEAEAQMRRLADIAARYGVELLPPDTFCDQGD